MTNPRLALLDSARAFRAALLAATGLLDELQDELPSGADLDIFNRTEELIGTLRNERYANSHGAVFLLVERDDPAGEEPCVWLFGPLDTDATPCGVGVTPEGFERAFRRA